MKKMVSFKVWGRKNKNFPMKILLEFVLEETFCFI